MKINNDATDTILAGGSDHGKCKSDWFRENEVLELLVCLL